MRYYLSSVIIGSALLLSGCGSSGGGGDESHIPTKEEIGNNKTITVNTESGTLILKTSGWLATVTYNGEEMKWYQPFEWYEAQYRDKPMKLSSKKEVVENNKKLLYQVSVSMYFNSDGRSGNLDGWVFQCWSETDREYIFEHHGASGTIVID